MSAWIRILTSLAALACAISAQAGVPVSREDQFKAAYLFNFLKFVDWPASLPSDVITVCFMGADGVYDTLAPDIEDKRAAARRLALRRLEPNADPHGCHVLYIDAAVLAKSGARPVTAEQPILTISDAAGFTNSGGIIELFTVDNRLRFSIDVTHAQKIGLRISSNLLQLAAQVHRSEP
jgi:hypothetical protein